MTFVVHVDRSFGVGQLRLLLQRRGMDFELTADEQLVYEALLRERRLPGGGAHLVSQDD